MARQTLPLPMTWLHQLEFRNALRLRVFRKEITQQQRNASLNSLLADLAAGVLAHVELPLADVTTEAERLSAEHSETLGTRSLDVLHVASALVLGLSDFLSFDHRQHALAAAAGLKAPVLSRS
jgi:predicted nucleic acid-binding protein